MRSDLRRGGLFTAVLCLGLYSGCAETFDEPTEVVPARLDGAELVPLKDGDEVQLSFPLQGGHVLFIGAFFRNAGLKGGSVLGELRRSQPVPGSPGLFQPGELLYSDERSAPASEVMAGRGPTAQPGWRMVIPDRNNVANIPTCPNPLNIDIVDNALFVQVRYRDQWGNEGTAARRVKPVCTSLGTFNIPGCRCECAASYTVQRCANL